MHTYRVSYFNCLKQLSRKIWKIRRLRKTFKIKVVLSEEGQNDKINFRKKLNFLRSHKNYSHIFKLYDFLVNNMILLIILYKIKNKNIKIKLSKN